MVITVNHHILDLVLPLITVVSPEMLHCVACGMKNKIFIQIVNGLETENEQSELPL